jgi:hypothetical protein
LPGPSIPQATTATLRHETQSEPLFCLPKWGTGAVHLGGGTEAEADNSSLVGSEPWVDTTICWWASYRQSRFCSLPAGRRPHWLPTLQRPSKFTATPKASIPLQGTEWVLAPLHGRDPVEGSPLPLASTRTTIWRVRRLQLVRGQLQSCGQGLHIGQIHRTDFDCGGAPGIVPQDEAFFETLASIAAYPVTEMARLALAGVMEQEVRQAQFLAAATSYHIYGDRLWLETGDGQVLVFIATEWQMAAALWRTMQSCCAPGGERHRVR